MTDSPVKYVKQLEGDGCGIACFAMVTGMTYKQARKFFALRKIRGGISTYALDARLARAGFAVCRLHKPLPGQSWPTFFAPLHIMRVKTEPGRQKTHHYIVVDAQGVVYDPQNRKAKTLSAYSRVLDFAGIIPLPKK